MNKEYECHNCGTKNLWLKIGNIIHCAYCMADNTEEIDNSSKCPVCDNWNNVTRIEIIDENGRLYVNWDKDNKITAELQDEGRTLKIFVSKEK